MSRQTDENRPRAFLTSPLLFASVCFALGIVAASWWQVTRAEVINSVPFILGAACACMLAGLMLLRARQEALAWAMALMGFVVAGIVAGGLFDFRFPPHHVSHLEGLGVDLADPIRLTGSLASAPIETPSGIQFDLDLENLDDRGRDHALSGKVRLRLQRARDPQEAEAADSLHLRYGDTIRALVRLERGRVYRDPGVFNYRRWLESVEDVSWLGTIKSPLLVEKLPRRGFPGPGIVLDRARNKLLAGIDRLYPPWSAYGRHGAVLKAVLLGDRSSLDSDTVDNFRQSGLYHLLVISGLHVGLLAMLITLLVKLFPVGDGVRSAIVLISLAGYCSLVDLRAPTLRATIMIAAYLVGRTLYREHAGLNAIGLAALLLLVVRPAWIFESGFELSFAAALLIVGLVVPILERTTEPYRRALRNVKDADIDQGFAPRLAQMRLDVRGGIERIETGWQFLKNHPSISTVVVTFPLRIFVWTVNILLFTAILQIGLLLPMAETFHRVTFAGIGLNALAIPLMTVLLGLAVPTILLSVVSPVVAAWPAKVLAMVMSLLFYLTDLPHLPAWLSYRVPSPPAWVAYGFAICVVMTACALGRSKRTFWTSTTGITLFALLISLDPFPPRLPAGRVEVTALDCGAGDATFVVLPDRTTLLYDACGGRGRDGSESPFEARRWDAGENIVSPYLWSRGVKKIDILVLGRGSESPLASFAAIARNFGVGEIWHGSGRASPAVLAFLDELEHRRIPVREISAGYTITRSTSSIEVLWPPPGIEEELGGREDTRDDSIALRIATDGASAILAVRAFETPGNVASWPQAPAERRMLVWGGDALSNPLASSFLAGRNPVLIVQGDEGASPEDSLQDAWTAWSVAKGASVYRTALHGAVTVEMQKAGISVYTYRMSAGEGKFVSIDTAADGSSSLSVR